MGHSNPLQTNNDKLTALERSLNQSVQYFRELALDYEQLRTESQECKQEYLANKEKCENKNCKAAEEFRKIIASKDQIIHSVASTLTKLSETKNFDMLAEAFKILFEEVAILTPPDNITTRNSPSACNKENVITETKSSSGSKTSDTSIMEDISFKEESVCEIQGTPTGRKSPVIQTKKTKSMLNKIADGREKKKCANDWPTSDKKAVKLNLTPSKHSTPKGSGKLRQSRLNLVKMKTSTVVDLTCSPELLAMRGDTFVQPLIKKESSEYDDTILPSPTSEPTNFGILKSTTKCSPIKFKKPLSLRSRSENIKQEKTEDPAKIAEEMEESINILNQHFANRIREIKKETLISQDNDSAIKSELSSPCKRGADIVKKEIESVKMEVVDEDATNASISMLEHVEKIEDNKLLPKSPQKRPLGENINILNTPPKNDLESSMSLLNNEAVKPAIEAVKRKLPELVEPVYKEPTVRTKAEKRNLQGWSCEECKNFYGVLYKDDPVMLAKKINDCSKHRGRHNPARPATPPNFWNPRWTVPDDTEELNRMNNAD